MGGMYAIITYKLRIKYSTRTHNVEVVRWLQQTVHVSRSTNSEYIVDIETGVHVKKTNRSVGI